MKKIIHLSDPHIGYEDCGAKFRQIVENITLIKQPARDYVIIITGDLVDNATLEAQMEEALDSIEQLKLRGYSVLVIPGNHDYGTGSWASPKYVNLFKATFFGDANLIYPKVDVIGNVLFIGLDSTADELHWYDRALAEGEIGFEQLERLKDVLANSKYINKKKIIYLHHHPFDYQLGLQLKDSEALKAVVENKVDALLFGHLHDDSSNVGKIYNGTWGIPRVYNGGSATHKNENVGSHHVIDLNKDPRTDYDAQFI